MNLPNRIRQSGKRAMTFGTGRTPRWSKARLSDGWLTTPPGSIHMQVLPPPSRLMASVQPSICIIHASCGRVRPMACSGCLPSAVRSTAEPSALSPIAVRGWVRRANASGQTFSGASRLPSITSSGPVTRTCRVCRRSCALSRNPMQ